jgi:hypothetical protein
VILRFPERTLSKYLSFVNFIVVVPNPDPGSMGSLDPYPDSQYGSRRAKMTHKHRKKVNKFHFLKC